MPCDQHNAAECAVPSLADTVFLVLAKFGLRRPVAEGSKKEIGRGSLGAQPAGSGPGAGKSAAATKGGKKSGTQQKGIMAFFAKK